MFAQNKNSLMVKKIYTTILLLEFQILKLHKRSQSKWTHLKRTNGNLKQKLFMHCIFNKPTRNMSKPVHSLKHGINLRNAHHEMKFNPKDLLFIHKRGEPFKYDHLNGWLLNVLVTVAGRMNVKFDPSNYPAHTLRQRGCTDMARQEDDRQQK